MISGLDMASSQAQSLGLRFRAVFFFFGGGG